MTIKSEIASQRHVRTCQAHIGIVYAYDTFQDPQLKPTKHMHDTHGKPDPRTNLGKTPLPALDYVHSLERRVLAKSSISRLKYILHI